MHTQNVEDRPSVSASIGRAKSIWWRTASAMPGPAGKFRLRCRSAHPCPRGRQYLHRWLQSAGASCSRVWISRLSPRGVAGGPSVRPVRNETVIDSLVCSGSAVVISGSLISRRSAGGTSRFPCMGRGGGVGGRSRRVGGRALQSWSTCVSRGAPLLLVLYLALIASPVLHQLLESHGRTLHVCSVEEAGWRILSHPPDEPCSAPDHHHHPGPVHDEDHCLTCRLGGIAVGVVPFVGAPIRPILATPSVATQIVMVPLSPELLTSSPRAPPPLPTA